MNIKNITINKNDAQNDPTIVN